MTSNKHLGDLRRSKILIQDVLQYWLKQTQANPRFAVPRVSYPHPSSLVTDPSSIH
jgi:hypothetical protein